MDTLVPTRADGDSAHHPSEGDASLMRARETPSEVSAVSEPQVVPISFNNQRSGNRKVEAEAYSAAATCR